MRPALAELICGAGTRVDWQACAAVATLAAVLVALWPIWEGWRQAEGFSPEEMKLLQRIESLFSEAHLLKKAEHDQLGLVLVNLSGTASLPTIPPKFAKTLLDVVDQAIGILQKKPFLRKRKLVIPWEE